MAKYANPLVLDAALAVVAAATRLVVTSGQPASLAEADSARLAETALDPADLQMADAPGGGRRLMIGGKAGLVALANGTADHVALIDDGAGRLLHVTSCPAVALQAGVAIDVAGWDLRLGGPL